MPRPKATTTSTIASQPNIQEPELPLREAVIFLFAVIVFVALMAWAAMQWM
jgi:hypothetical protein